MKRPLCVLIALLFSIATCSVAWAQSASTAQITGAVKDQSGAVLPGVEVSVTQIDTGLRRSVPTDETGSYVLANLPVGPYRLEAALPGFRTYVQTGIVLQVNSNPVINAVLQVGQVSETVEVPGSQPITRASAVETLARVRRDGVHFSLAGESLPRLHPLPLRRRRRLPRRRHRRKLRRPRSRAMWDFWIRKRIT